mmetsp:Transcript_12692/g.44425  ORF Transcript_12692/g.44425 Transcript_12692/m.44425 type:complete len:223 (-) Transcript_12692:2154-2822(-)
MRACDVKQILHLPHSHALQHVVIHPQVVLLQQLHQLEGGCSRLARCGWQGVTDTLVDKSAVGDLKLRVLRLNSHKQLHDLSLSPARIFKLLLRLRASDASRDDVGDVVKEVQLGVMTPRVCVENHLVLLLQVLPYPCFLYILRVFHLFHMSNLRISTSLFQLRHFLLFLLVRQDVKVEISLQLLLLLFQLVCLVLHHRELCSQVVDLFHHLVRFLQAVVGWL